MSTAQRRGSASPRSTAAVMDGYLDHAQKLERSNSLEPGSVLTAKLAPDMLTFGEQFSVNCNKVELHLTKLMPRPKR
jgi:uncharacterized protein